MEAYLRLKMDRLIQKDLHYISPGGYDFETEDGKIYGMDFTLSEGCIDTKDSSIIEFTLKHADYESFPEMAELRNRLEDIVQITEFYIYTGEDGEPEIRPEKILEFQIMDTGTGEKPLPHSTKYIHVDFTRYPKPNDSTWLCTYTFKRTPFKFLSFEV
ncbi:MAG: hypothetical protein ACLTER_11310 [Ruminococcus sp.]